MLGDRGPAEGRGDGLALPVGSKGSSLHVIASFRNLDPERDMEGSEVERVALGVLGGVGGKCTSGAVA